VLAARSPLPPGRSARFPPAVVDLALVEALMGMEPGIPHELVPAAAGLPAIFVEDCTDGAPPMRR